MEKRVYTKERILDLLESKEDKTNPLVELIYDEAGRLEQIVKTTAEATPTIETIDLYYTGDQLTSVTKTVEGIVKTKTFSYENGVLISVSEWI